MYHLSAFCSKNQPAYSDFGPSAQLVLGYRRNQSVSGYASVTLLNLFICPILVLRIWSEVAVVDSQWGLHLQKALPSDTPVADRHQISSVTAVQDEQTGA